MSNQEQAKIFANNMNYWMARTGIMQIELADALHIPTQTVNSWCKGVCIPRMDRVQMIADYFHIGKSDLLEPRKGTTLKSIDNAMDTLLEHREATRDKNSLEDFLVTLSDKDIQLLIEVASRSKKEDIKLATAFLERLNGDR